MPSACVALIFYLKQRNQDFHLEVPPVSFFFQADLELAEDDFELLHPPASCQPSTWVIGMPHTTDSKLTESTHVHAPKLSSKIEQAADNFGGKSFGYANRRETLGWAECRMGCQTEPKLQGSKRALWTRSLSCLTPVNIRKEGWRGTDLYLPWLPV